MDVTEPPAEESPIDPESDREDEFPTRSRPSVFREEVDARGGEMRKTFGSGEMSREAFLRSLPKALAIPAEIDFERDLVTVGGVLEMGWSLSCSVSEDELQPFTTGFEAS